MSSDNGSSQLERVMEMSKFRPPSALTTSFGLEDDRISKGLKLEVFAAKTFDDMADWRTATTEGAHENIS